MWTTETTASCHPGRGWSSRAEYIKFPKVRLPNLDSAKNAPGSRLRIAPDHGFYGIDCRPKGDDATGAGLLPVICSGLRAVPVRHRPLSRVSVPRVTT